jgi:hypothetical protein
MEMDKVTEKTLEMIYKLLKGKNQFDTWYTMPYSESDDDRVDVHIDYKIQKVLIRKHTFNPDYLFNATIVIEPIKISLGVNDDWETGFKQHDISEYIWDILSEDAVEGIESILPHVFIIIDFDFTTINS